MKIVLAAAIIMGLSAATAMAAPCSGISLKIDSGRQDAAMSKTAYAYTITNIGAKTCTIEGYPGIELLDVMGHPVAAMKIEQSPTSYFTSGGAPTSIKMPPRGEASFTIEMISADVTGKACQKAVEARVTLPGTETPSTFAGSFTACGEAVHVTPLRSGAGSLQ